MIDKDKQLIFFSSERPATAHCSGLARQSLHAAEIQIECIWKHSLLTITMQDILIDVHFYFIALRNLYRFLNKIVEDPIFNHLQPTVSTLNEKWFKHYAKGREAFEHIDQRLPGEKHESRILEITENGASRKIHFGLDMENALFTHSNLALDISKGNFYKIKEGVLDLFKNLIASCPSNQFEL